MPISPRTPKMGLTKPTPGGDLNQWGLEINDDLDIIDGYGPPYTTSELDIDADLSLNSNNLTDTRSVRMDNQSSVLSGVNDVRSIYVKNNELFYNDNAGNHVQITNGGQLNPSLLSFIYLSPTTVSGDITILSTDAYNCYFVDTSAARNINLPLAATAGAKFYFFKDFTGNSRNNAITLTAAGSDTLDGSGTYTLSKSFGAWLIVSDSNSVWSVFNYSNLDMNNGTIETDSVSISSSTGDVGIAANGGDLNLSAGGTIKTTTPLTASALVTINAALVTSGDVTLGDTTGDQVTINGSTLINGATDIDNGVSVLNGHTFNATGDVNLGSTTADTLTVNSNTTINGAVDIDNGVSILNGHTFNATGDTSVGGSLTVTGTTDLNNAVSVNNGHTLNATGDVVVGSHLTVGQTATFNSSVVLGDSTADSVTLNSIFFQSGNGRMRMKATLATGTTASVDVRQYNFIRVGSGTSTVNLTGGTNQGEWFYIYNIGTGAVTLGGSLQVNTTTTLPSGQWRLYIYMSSTGYYEQMATNTTALP